MTTFDRSQPSRVPAPEGMRRLLRAVDARQRERLTLMGRLCASVASLDAMREEVGFDVPDPVDIEAETIARDDARYVRALVASLPGPLDDVVRWRFGLDGPALTLGEVALALGVSDSTAGRTEREALALLRQGMSLQEEGVDFAFRRVGPGLRP